VFFPDPEVSLQNFFFSRRTKVIAFLAAVFDCSASSCRFASGTDPEKFPPPSCFCSFPPLCALSLRSPVVRPLVFSSNTLTRPKPHSHRTGDRFRFDFLPFPRPPSSPSFFFPSLKTLLECFSRSIKSWQQFPQSAFVPVYPAPFFVVLPLILLSFLWACSPRQPFRPPLLTAPSPGQAPHYSLF